MKENSFRRFFKPHKSPYEGMYLGNGSFHTVKKPKRKGTLVWESRVWHNGILVGNTRLRNKQYDKK